MAVADTAKLIVDLSLKGNFAKQLGAASKAAKSFDKDASRAYKAGTQIGTGIKRGAYIAAAGVGFLVSQVAFGLDSLIKLEGMTAQTEAVLKSTGGVADVTAGQVRDLAEEFEALNATIGDETIQNAENLLLTFTNVNRKAFKPALQAALDMNQALGGGPEGLANVTKLLGKALQDPEKGLSRLGRAVGGFDDATTKAVKAALKQNDTLKAQNIIIAELERRYGGSFARAGDTVAGKVAKFGDAIEDLQRSLAVALLPTVSNVADALTELLRDKEVQQGVEDLGKSIASLFTKQNIKDGVAALKEGFGFIRSIVGPIADIVKTAVNAFTSLPPEVQKLAVGAFAVNKLTGGLVTNLAGGLIGAVLKSFGGKMFVAAGVVNVAGPVAGLPGGGGVPTPFGAAQGTGGLSGLIKGLPIIGVGIAAAEIANEVASGVAGAIKTALPGPVGTTVAGVIKTTVGAFSGALGLPNLIGGVQDLVGQVATLLAPARNDRALDRPRNVGPSGNRDAVKQVEMTDKVRTAVETMKGKLTTSISLNKQAIDASKTAITAAQQETKRETARGDALVRAGVQSGSAAIVSAINRIDVTPRFTVNVTPSGTTVIRRYGTTAGSRWIDSPDKVRD